MRSRGFGHMAIEAAIDECLRLNYLDDSRFAETYATQLHRKGFGINIIKYKLYLRGVPDFAIHEAVEARGDDAVQFEQCRRVLAKKRKTLTGEDLENNHLRKLQRFLYSRGFSGHIIAKAIDEAVNGSDTTSE